MGWTTAWWKYQVAAAPVIAHQRPTRADDRRKRDVVDDMLFVVPVFWEYARAYDVYMEANAVDEMTEYEGMMLAASGSGRKG